MNIQEFISRERARADCYRFLSVCFYQPRKDVFIEEGLFRNLADSIEQVSNAAALAREMEAAFLKIGEEELSVAYAKLFVGPHELIAPPYGSLYLDREQRVMGDTTMEVINLYREAGLAMDEDYREVPDHITAELEFMYYLLSRECRSLEQADREGALRFLTMQEMFFNRYLGSWVPAFCDRIRLGTENEFYVILAGCLSAFINGERAGAVLPDEFLTDVAKG